MSSEYVVSFLSILYIQVPAQQRMVSLFLWQTFCPLVVIYCSKLYQRFAVKRMKRLVKGLEDFITAAVRRIQMTHEVSVSTSAGGQDTMLN